MFNDLMNGIPLFHEPTVSKSKINLLENLIELDSVRTFIHIASKPFMGTTTLGLNISRAEKRPILYIDTVNSLNDNMNITDNMYVFSTNKFQTILDFIDELPKMSFKFIVIDSLNNLLFPEEDDIRNKTPRYELIHKYIRILMDRCYSRFIGIIAFNGISDYTNKPSCYSSQFKKMIDHDLLITSSSFLEDKTLMTLKDVKTNKKIDLELER